MTSRNAGILFAIITGVCWALLAIALRQAHEVASTGTISWFRMVVAFVALLIWYGVRQPSSLKLLALPRRPAVLICGLGLAFNYFAYMRGLEMTSAANAQIMIQVGPLALLMFGIFYFNEKPTGMQTLGLGVAALGFALFFWDQILNAVDHAGRYVEGNLWIFGGALTWAVFAVLQKSLKGAWSAQQFNMVIYGICSVALLPLCRFQEIAAWDLNSWILLSLCGANTLVAYGFFAEALQRIPASHVSLIISVNPLLTIFLITVLAEFSVSWVVPESIHWRGFLGALLVVTGVILTIRRKTQMLPVKHRIAT